ncbi:MAG: Fe/S biogenesis protein NfuA [bacterium ADurb.Bin270]|jgi:Fe-S cluster biogenesis protein NfuA|nr:NifU family protein [Myxococcales bacterium]OQA62213.1 MAG: Fe/S biogenesis protein NfuA [bacterium ADurb.Bin270]HQG12838.1 NifU family protein [bacterium]HQH81030.1 NifU family protein [bacterium]
MDRNAVEKVLDDKVRPKLAMDGGGVELVDVRDDNTVVVKLVGACGCCPFSQMTLKAGVEAELKAAFPELKAVVTG